MTGPAGAGKTEVIKGLERVLADEDLGTLLLTAFTGSAVVTLETLLTLNCWGITAPTTCSPPLASCISLARTSRTMAPTSSSLTRRPSSEAARTRTGCAHATHAARATETPRSRRTAPASAQTRGVTQITRTSD